MLQSSALQCIAVSCRVLQYVMQCVAVQNTYTRDTGTIHTHTHTDRHTLAQCLVQAVCCSVLQYVLQYVL